MKCDFRTLGLMMHSKINSATSHLFRSSDNSNKLYQVHDNRHNALV